MFEHLATWIPGDVGEYPEEISAGRDKVSVRIAAHWVNRLESKDGDERTRYVAVQYDSCGRFFITERISHNKDGKVIAETIRAVRPDQALRHYISRSFQECAFREELLRELENPPLPGMAPLATTPHPRRRARPRKGNAKLRPLAVQLEMATALVGVAQQLADAPSVETLSAARRAVSQLHQSLHTEETFRAASA